MDAQTHGKSDLYNMPCLRQCVYSNSRNDVPRVAQRYGTIAARTRRCASVLVVFVVFCVHMYSFAGLIKADATADVLWHCNHRPPLWYHYFPAQSSLGADFLVYWIGKSFGHVHPVGVEPSTSCVRGEHPIHSARLSALIPETGATKNVDLGYSSLHILW